MTELISPLIEQRADPFIYKHTDGYYYFTGSVPAYNGIELRRAKTIAGLAEATPVMVWHKPDTGPLSDLIWAPEIHRSEEHTSELQSRGHIVCRLLLEKKKQRK